MNSFKIQLKTPRLLSLYQYGSGFWDTIVSLGITDEISDWDKKRIRLLNGISTIAVLALTIYCLIFLDPAHRIPFWLSFQGLIAYLFFLFLTYKRKYNVACHFFNIYNVLSYSFMAISQGSGYASEYILVPSSIASMLLFREKKIIFGYFILNAFFFALCKYSFTVMKPVLLMPNGENLYTPNHILMFIILFLVVYYFKSENTRQENLLGTRNLILADEKHKSESLLLNILPKETAEELKKTGTAKTKIFKSVTIMFTDFKNFTNATEKISPEKLVKEIHEYFSFFDAVMDKYHIEKIKTIGDSYMCAGGIPEENNSHPEDVVRAALEIQQFMQDQKKEKESHNEMFFELRLGVHTGPVIAGIVGTKKFAYDIWGDTVNIASRMESSGEVGRVNISASTYELIKDKIDCEYRGKITAKNKGEIEMYFVNEYNSRENNCN